MNTILKVFLIAIAGCGLVGNQCAHALTTTWKTLPVGSWLVSTNWTAGVPGTGDNAVADNGGYAVISGGVAEAGSLTIGKNFGAAVQMFYGGTLNVTGKLVVASGLLNLVGDNSVKADTAVFGLEAYANVVITGLNTIRVHGATAAFVPNTLLGVDEDGQCTFKIDGVGSKFLFRNIGIGVKGNASVQVINGAFVSGLSSAESGIYLGYSNSGKGSLIIGEGGAPGFVNGTILSRGSGIIVFNHSGTNYYFSDNGKNTGNGVVILESNVAISANGIVAIDHIGSGKTTLFGSAQQYRGYTRVQAGTLCFSSDTVSLESNVLVGLSGKARLEIDNGCDVSNTRDVSLGVNVSGSGSLWLSGFSSKLIARDIQVGSFGTAAVEVVNGGLLQTKSGGIGFLFGSGKGDVLVSGADSRWELAAGSLIVGGAGYGRVEVGDSGALSVGGGTGVLEVANLAGATGFVHVTGSDPGVLSIGRINGGAGRACLVFDHESVDYFFTTTGMDTGVPISLTGAMDIRHEGTGTTTLSHTYFNTGVCAINSGALTVDGTLGEDFSTVVSATLAGTGTLNATVTILGSGTISPGSSAGVLTVLADLDLQGRYLCELDGDLNDKLVVTGVMIISSGNLDVRDTTNGLTRPVYKIAQYGSLVGGSFDSVNKPSRYTVDYNYQGSNIIALVDQSYVAWATNSGLDLEVNGGYYQDPNNDQRENIYHYSFDSVPSVGPQLFNRGIYIVPDGDVPEYLTFTFPVLSGSVFTGLPMQASVGGIVYKVTAMREPEGALLPVVQRTPAFVSGLPLSNPNYTYVSFRLDTNVIDFNEGIIQIEARQD